MKKIILLSAASLLFFAACNTNTEKKEVANENLLYFGDTINQDNAMAVAEVAKILDGKDSVKVTFYKYDFVIQKAEKYTEYNSLSEDAIWHERFGLIKSEGNKLFRYDDVKKEWLLLFDLSTFGIKKITRFNFDSKNNYLVIVDNL